MLTFTISLIFVVSERCSAMYKKLQATHEL